MKNILGFTLFVLLVFSCSENKYQTLYEKDSNNYVYEKVVGDESRTRVYTLGNGLKVYLSVNDEEPRIYTQIGVRAGSTYDPKETTGLAHYLEHMLFKGTSRLGAMNWEKEKPLLDQIRWLYEEHKKESDIEKKKIIYKKIDSVSQLAAQYVSPNEFDKLITNIGATGTNAYTSTEVTAYINEIPSNEIRRWLAIEQERFSELVLRLFHTELEAVYEEFNMRMKDSDGSKAFKSMFELLYLKHPLGTQTTIGEPEHLKNPSWVNIEDYFKKYYVPNNMCLAMSGDLNMDSTIKMIDEFFGGFKMKEVPPINLPEEAPIEKVRSVDIYGPDEEFIIMGFRLGNNKSGDEKYAQLLSKMLYNGTAGLIDLNLVQKQRLLGASTFYWQHRDYGTQMFWGYARKGQNLDEVKELILEQLDKLKKGEFDQSLMQSAITDLRKESMKYNESNYYRCSNMIDAFIQEYDWSTTVSFIDEMAAIKKEELMAFANNNFSDDNYVIGYKRSGVDTTIAGIEKPKITPVPLNRNSESEKYKELSNMETSDISARFLNFDQDLKTIDFKEGVTLKVIENKINSRFSLTYYFDMGKDHSKTLALAINFLPLLGTEKYSPAELKQEWYSLGVDFSVRTGEDQSYVRIGGIKESMVEAVKLLDHSLRDIKIDKETYHKYVEDVIKRRENNMKSKGALFYAAINYATYGHHSSFTNILREEELKNMDLSVIESKLRSLLDHPHEILYYGAHSEEEIMANLKGHIIPEELLIVGDKDQYTQLDLDIPKVYFIDYDMEQTFIVALSKSESFNKSFLPYIKMYNTYFGSGLSSIVFQEIRESRALAYSANSRISIPDKIDNSHYLSFSAMTQADKLADVVSAFNELFAELPEAIEQFEGAKTNILKEIESERITKTSIYREYRDAKKKGLDEDVRKYIYDTIKSMTFDDFRTFFNNQLNERAFHYVVIGNRSKVDMAILSNLGEVKELSRKEVFNYD